MFRLYGVATAASLFAGLSFAQTITAPEGNWVWQAELDMNGLNLTDEGATCIGAENAELDLARAALNVSEACSIFGWNPQGEKTYFALACLGDQAADMAGVLTMSGDTAELELSGDVRLGESGALPSIARGVAKRTGACPAPDVSPVAADVADVAMMKVDKARFEKAAVSPSPDEGLPPLPEASVVADAPIHKPVENLASLAQN